MPIIENRKENVPFEYYKKQYTNLVPEEAAQRCGVEYDAGTRTFRIRFMYINYRIAWPDFSIDSEEEAEFAQQSIPAQILIIRFLLEGHRAERSPVFLTYREMPWGEVYYQAFSRRCLTRAAYSFGMHLTEFRSVLSGMQVTFLNKGDVSCQFEVLPGYDIQLILWEGDEEFPPASQILFSENFPQSFSAEDRAVIGDLLISNIKKKMK